MLYVENRSNHNIPEDQIIRDVEAEFICLDLEYNQVNSRLIKVIDQGEMISDNTFKDRFGKVLYTHFLSTGCKAALLVNSSDKYVDTLECGDNAKEAIFLACDGKILVETPLCNFSCENKKGQWVCNGQLYRDLYSLVRVLS